MPAAHGQTREDGSTYSDEQAMRDYASRVAGLDPRESLRARGEADALAMRGLQRRSAERTARYEDYADKVMDIRRRIAAGGDPVALFREGAGIFNSVNDGKFAGMSEDGQNLTLFDAGTGTTKIVPFNTENVLKAIDGLHALASPQAMEKAKEMGLRERTVAATERNARTNEQHRQDQAPVLAAQARYYGSRAKAGASGGQRQLTPEMTKEINGAYEAYQVAVDSGDPAAIRAARRQYDAAVTKASTLLGRPRMLGAAGDEKPEVDPESAKEYRKAMVELGPRPKDPRRAATWDENAAHIRSVYGVRGQPNILDRIGGALGGQGQRGVDPNAAAYQAYDDAQLGQVQPEEPGLLRRGWDAVTGFIADRNAAFARAEQEHADERNRARMAQGLRPIGSYGGVGYRD